MNGPLLTVMVGVAGLIVEGAGQRLRVGVGRVGAGEGRHDGVGAGGRRRRGGAVVSEGEAAGDRCHAVGADRGGGGRVRVAVVGERPAADASRSAEGQHVEVEGVRRTCRRRCVAAKMTGCCADVGRGRRVGHQAGRGIDRHPAARRSVTTENVGAGLANS